jgi:hypothetical protein
MASRQAIIATLSGVLACSTACGDTPENIASTSQAVVGVVFKWSSLTNQRLAELAPRNDGSALASTREDVIAFSPNGTKTVVFDGTMSNGPPVLREGTEGFAVEKAGALDLYDASGAKKGSAPMSSLQYARLVPGSLQSFVPSVDPVGVEEGRVTQGRILSSTGAQVSSFPAGGLLQSRTTASHVVWATASALNKTTLAGANVWSMPIWAHKFEVSTNARYSIVNRGEAKKTVDLYDEKLKKGTSTFGRAVWNLAMAPAGQYAAANDKTSARLFKNGALQATVQLGTTVFPVSLDVSDLGYVLVTTHSPPLASSKVSLYDAIGVLRWSQTLPADSNAFRPEVRFTPNGLGFFVREKMKLSYYGLVNP